jgi:hypothetical protein
MSRRNPCGWRISTQLLEELLENDNTLDGFLAKQIALDLRDARARIAELEEDVSDLVASGKLPP